LGATLANFQLGKIKMAQEKYKSSIPYFLEATKNPSIASYAHAFLVEAYDRTNQQDKATEHVLIMAKQPIRVNRIETISLCLCNSRNIRIGQGALVKKVMR